jgi:hypothetical protein
LDLSISIIGGQGANGACFVVIGELTVRVCEFRGPIEVSIQPFVPNIVLLAGAIAGPIDVVAFSVVPVVVTVSGKLAHADSVPPRAVVDGSCFGVVIAPIFSARTATIATTTIIFREGA